MLAAICIGSKYVSCVDYESVDCVCGLQKRAFNLSVDYKRGRERWSESALKIN